MIGPIRGTGQPMSLFEELKRRNVIRMAGLYVVGAWLITQVAGTVLPMFGAPDWIGRSIVALLAIGFVPTLLFSWIYELTPEGLKRESAVDRSASITSVTGRRIDRSITVMLVLALAYFIVDKFVLAPGRNAREIASAVDQANVASAAKGPASSAGAASTSAAAAGTAAAPSIPSIDQDPSIAVLPLQDLSQAKDQEYFSDGITEELLDLLAKVPKLRVIARTSSFSYKGKDTPIAEIARALHVAAVLEGSVRKSGEKVRITVQLIRASDSSHLWSETYDRKLDDIFKVQDDIAAAVVDKLRITLLGAVPTAKPVDPRIYPLILQANALAAQNNAAGNKQALALCEQALAVVPGEVRAWDVKALLYFSQTAASELSTEEGVPLIRAAVERALALDPNDAAAHSVAGRVADVYDGDFVSAAAHYQRALSLDPTSSDALYNIAVFLASTGKVDAGITVMRYLVAHDPASARVHYRLGDLLSRARHNDEAITSLRAALALSPQYNGAHNVISASLLAKGDAAGALVEAEAESSETWRAISLPLAYYAVGRKAEADAALSALIAKLEKDASYNIAYIYAFRGEADRAFEWLDKAVQYKDGGLSEIVYESLFDKIRSDPRWLPLLRKIGRSPEQLAKIEFEVTLPQ
ncbi:MAG TPA: tetratricopeptide repeat protein [Rudaea sp.]|nr:tetratricopeptide repeat protein [Rudaea sp.]